MVRSFTEPRRGCGQEAELRKFFQAVFYRADAAGDLIRGRGGAKERHLHKNARRCTMRVGDREMVSWQEFRMGAGHADRNSAA